ncbi:SRPBCC domain-containing protein [Pusillimonas sp.]|uniref:SRPBCC domain-containing protein n=1 Tax=Pusillimonas sp. TaxID=3040095 RepID=UPI0029AE8033|nr:SRPBCC domain-containing protein [Pusillimonas sp.]MDX3896236.1 SRPBCC domain-containing protein [Pusillimonas sp.]
MVERQLDAPSEPPHLLAFTWDGSDGGEVAFAFSAQGEKTLLVSTHTGLRGRDDAVNFGGGWHAHLAVLEKRIKGKPCPTSGRCMLRLRRWPRKSWGGPAPDERL